MSDFLVVHLDSIDERLLEYLDEDEEMKQAESATAFLQAIEEQDDVSLTDAVRAYLRALEAWLDVYPEMRTTEE